LPPLRGGNESGSAEEKDDGLNHVMRGCRGEAVEKKASGTADSKK